MKIAAALAIGLFALGGAQGAIAADDEPWKNKTTSLVIDAYELNTVEWDKMVTNKRIAGFISKASDGLPEVYDCSRKHNGDTVNHCKTMWRKYAVSRELHQTRRLLAKANGLLWGAYHLGRPGNPVDQANHFLDYAAPGPEDMMVLDIESLDSSQFMSLDDAETFARHIKARTGRYPVLYINHDTARYIATRREQYRLLSRLPLWYARYKPEIKGVFPMGNWDNYMLWQFSSSTNCDDRSCPMRIEGTLDDIDVNTVPISREALAKIWGKGELLPEKPPALQYLVNVKGSLGTSALAGLGFGSAHSLARVPSVLTALNYQED
ncbi:lysozyme [Rhizobium sp. KVB221]|uniref:Lysozyme n=1 Tax=Rhizobium setariae TaxID=2801340 RepID=A0A936YL83_9HYPH|nr:GH25 family lysozyme [Rhizobium setariae]MBL0370787.1 lysozyme [Rhizobium setariae]